MYKPANLKIFIVFQVFFFGVFLILYTVKHFSIAVLYLFFRNICSHYITNSRYIKHLQITDISHRRIHALFSGFIVDIYWNSCENNGRYESISLLHICLSCIILPTVLYYARKSQFSAIYCLLLRHCERVRWVLNFFFVVRLRIYFIIIRPLYGCITA